MENEKVLFDSYNKTKFMLEKKDITVSEYNLINYGLQFSISFYGNKGKVRIYVNKKGLINIDYSQIKDKNLIEIIHGEIKETTENKIENQINNLMLPIIGTDESGKGDYFGPLVCAAVYVNQKTENDLILCGVKDCKKLSDKKVLEISQMINMICKNNFVIIEISPEKYNELYKQFKNENKNLNHLLAWGHAKAIEELLSKVDANIAIADQFADESFIISKLQEKGKKIKLIQMPKAEQNIAVAAASILARARFLEKIEGISDKYKMKLPKGASLSVVEAGKNFVNLYGEENLNKVAKIHFKTTSQIFC